MLHSERFVDQSPAEVQATLLEGTDVSLAHEAFSTPLRERRAQARHRTRNRSSWRRPRIRSGRGISPERADPLPVLLAVCDPGSLSLRRGLVAAHENAHLAQRPRRRAASNTSVRSRLPRGPRRADAQQRPLEASHSRPRNAFPKPNSGALRFHRTRARDRPRSLRVVQRRASPQADLALWARGHDP